MEKDMPQAQRSESANDQQSGSTARPVKTFKQGGVEVIVWRNPGEKGYMYNTTIRNSYKEDVPANGKCPRASARPISRLCRNFPTRHFKPSQS
jgi:hypothetical protein